MGLADAIILHVSTFQLSILVEKQSQWVSGDGEISLHGPHDYYKYILLCNQHAELCPSEVGYDTF